MNSKPHLSWQGLLQETIWLQSILLLALLIRLDAIAPPYHDWDTFESVHQMRHRLNISYDYEPIHLNAEYCRYMTVSECRKEDQRIQDIILEHSQWQKQGLHVHKGPVAEYFDKIRNIPYTTNPKHRRTLEEQYRHELKRNLRADKPRRLNPSIANQIKVLVLLVKFKDHASRVVPPRTYYDEMFNGNGVSTNNPVGSVKEWLRYSSLGKYRVVFDVRDWQVSDKTEMEAAAGASGFVGPTVLQNFFTSTLANLDSSIDWLNGYVDDFGMTYHLVVLHSGYSAEFGQLNCLSNVNERNPANRIWSQGSSSLGTEGWTSVDYFSINGYATTSAFDVASCKTNSFNNPGGSKMGIITHEYNHGFGIPDLYDQDTTESVRLNIGGASLFAIMSNPWGWVRNGAVPGMHDPWSRQKIGWLTPIEITKNGYYSIQPSEISGHVYIIKTNFPTGEYLMIENRQPVKWDVDMPKNGTGLVIWHIDENQNGQKTRGYPGHTNWPTDHYMVAVEQADGLYNIEKGDNMGDVNDFWKNEKVLGTGRNFPNTDSIQMGKRKATGIKITVSGDPSFIMVFEVAGLPATNPAPEYTPTTRIAGDPRSTKAIVEWMLSLLLGTAALLGLLTIFMV